VELIVLGNSSRLLSHLGAGVSYLLSSGDTHLVIDAGNRTAERAREVLGGQAPSGLLLPHHHPPCLADAVPVLNMLPPGAPVFVPGGSMPSIRRTLLKEAARSAKELTFREVSEGDEALVGPFTLRFARAKHGCQGVAFRAEAEGRSITYLGDTGYLAGIRALSQNANLLVAHALLLDATSEGNVSEWNLSAGAAARLAAEARVARLAVAHMPFYSEAEASLAEARAHFPSEVIPLAEGARYVV